GSRWAAASLERNRNRQNSDRQDMNRARRAESDNVGLSDLGVGHLAILGALVAGEMPHNFADIGDARCAQRMALAQQPARYVDRIVAAEARMLASSRIDKRAGFAVTAQTQVFVMDQLRGSEAVVQFGERDILGTHARLLVGMFGSAPRQRAHVGQRRG